MEYVTLIFFILLLFYEKIWRIQICKKKITKYINKFNKLIFYNGE